jgi:hypothetical protein
MTSGRGPNAEPGGDRPPLWREIGFGLAVFAVYAAVATIDWPGRATRAAVNGRAIFRLEQALHLDIERALNDWLAPHEVLRVIANYEYAFTYVASALALIIWLYLRRPADYPWARNSFALLTLAGVTCFALYPVTPPRLLADLGFVDTVRLGHTWGSWGSPLVGHANQLAAMPSLHVAWALWVSVVLARTRGGPKIQILSAIHVLVTVFVIIATANHYLLDAVGGAVLVWTCVALVHSNHKKAGRTGGGPRVADQENRGRSLASAWGGTVREDDSWATSHQRVPAADAFFLHVDSPRAPQQVGGVVFLDTTDGDVKREDVAAAIRDHVPEIPRFRQRLAWPTRWPAGWRRPRWIDHPQVDWDWHVPGYDVTGADGRPGGQAALGELVAELAATPLPPDRPLWRFAVVRGVEEHAVVGVMVVHHVVADGFGTVAQALKFLEPPYDPNPSDGSASGPGRLRSAGAIAVGLGQLATDGRPSGRLPSGASAERRFGMVTVPLAEVRAVARRHGARVSDVLLTIVAGGIRRTLTTGTRPPGNPPIPERMRISVPLMVRAPGAATEGNVTAAVLMDVPLGPLSEPERLAGIAGSSRRLRTGTRALASRFVMQSVGEIMPWPVHRWFARTVYGGRFFHVIVSNMPGPDVQLTLAGAPLRQVYPLLPLADGAPLAAGALGWNGLLCVGIATDPALVDDPAELTTAIETVFAELRSETGQS